MLSVESIQVAEEEVVESTSTRLGEIYTLVADGCYPHNMNPIRKKNLKRYAQKFAIEDGRLYYVGPKKEEKREVVIEPETKRQIFLDCHFNDIGQHLGQKKTVHRIQSKYYWLGIVKDVVDWIKVCDTCQQNERNKNLARAVRPIKVDAPWDIVGIDIIGPFPETHQGNTSVLTLIDYFSKWVEAFPIQKTDIPSVARCISKSVYRFGAPKTIVCRQSVDFCNEVAELLRERWNLTQQVSPLAQQMNPLHDPTGGLLNEAIARMVAEKQTEWEDFLDPVTFLFRTSVNPTTKFSPFSLMFNREANVPLELSVLGPVDPELEGFPAQEEESSGCMHIMQTQQDRIKQMVTANMNSAYKQEKKNAKRRLRNMPSMTFKITDPMFGAGETPPAKKLKAESLFLSFPVEAELATDGCSDDRKSDLEYPIPIADVR
uniref:Gypsy retrotransposon integrase-like protein 1 n=1 Tax=Gadus morhua TaxID=8049 RepID=A0A8C4Z7X6_GADMO